MYVCLCAYSCAVCVMFVVVCLFAVCLECVFVLAIVCCFVCLFDLCVLLVHSEIVNSVFGVCN